PIASAKTVFTADPADVSANPVSYYDNGKRWAFISNSKTTWRTKYLMVTPDGRAIPTPVPETATIQDVLNGHLIVELNEPLGNVPVGSLVSWQLGDIVAGRATKPELIMAPTAKQAINEVATSNGILWVSALDDVQGKL